MQVQLLIPTEIPITMRSFKVKRKAQMQIIMLLIFYRNAVLDFFFFDCLFIFVLLVVKIIHVAQYSKSCACLIEFQ